MTQKFSSLRFVGTPKAMAKLASLGELPSTYFKRHLSGDWGNVDAHDQRANEAALIPDANGEYDRILSAYTLSDGTRVWVITEADRSVTTILLPEDY